MLTLLEPNDAVDVTAALAARGASSMPSAEFKDFTGAKVRVGSWYWSRRLQVFLSYALSCSWGAGVPVPWGTWLPLLVIERSEGDGTWRFRSVSDAEFAALPVPEWTAEALLSAYSS